MQIEFEDLSTTFVHLR